MHDPFLPTGEVPPSPRKSTKPVWIALAIVVGACLLACAIGALAMGADKSSTLPPTTDVSPPPGKTGEALGRAVPDPGVRPTLTPSVNPEPVDPKPSKPKFAKVSDRHWQKVARDPGSFTGKAYVIYGVVTQFDSATGTTTLRANTSGVNKTEQWDYDINTIMVEGKDGLFSDLVADDEFRAEVIVGGEFEYESVLGGDLTVPSVAVFSVKRL